MVTNFELNTGGRKGEREVELYAKAYVDDYTFKQNLFKNSAMIWVDQRESNQELSLIILYHYLNLCLFHSINT